MSRTIVGIALLCISAFIYVGKLISTSILVAAGQFVNSETWKAMLDMAPASIDIAIIIPLTLGAILLVLEQLLKFKKKNVVS